MVLGSSARLAPEHSLQNTLALTASLHTMHLKCDEDEEKGRFIMQLLTQHVGHIAHFLDSTFQHR